MAQQTFRVKLEGAAELKEALLGLRLRGSSRIAKNAVRNALLKAGKPIAAHARSLARIRSGQLKRTIRVSTTLSRRQKRTRAKGADPTETTVYIGAGPSRHAHLIEFGTGERFWRSGKSTGASQPHPFLRPAWDAGKMRALAEFGRLLWIEIERAAKRLAKRQAKKG